MVNKNKHSLLTKLTSFAAVAALAATMVAPITHAGDITGDGTNPVVTAAAGTGFPNEVGVTYTVIFDVSAVGALDSGSEITLSFPAGFDVSGATIDITGGSIASTASSVLSQDVTGTITGTVANSDTLTATITGVGTPTSAQRPLLTIATFDSIDDPVDTTPAGFFRVNVAIPATATPASETASADTTYSFTLTDMPALDAGDTIVLTFPDAPDSGISAAGFVNGDISGLAEFTAGVATYDSETETVTIPVSAGTTSAGDDITFDIANLTNPAYTNGGTWGIGVDVYDGGTTVIAQGVATASFANSVDVTAIVTEALILTLTNSAVSLTVDPAVNSGQDLTESTGLNVQTNSPSGYVLKARLDDGSGNAQLVDGNGNDITSSDQAGATDFDNYFGYKATNDNTGTPVGNATQGFGAVASNLYVGSGTTTSVGGSGVADYTVNEGGEHTVNYDLNVSFLTPAGVYTGTIYYTVVASF